MQYYLGFIIILWLMLHEFEIDFLFLKLLFFPITLFVMAYSYLSARLNEYQNQTVHKPD
jgi:hypothetical protein